ncbi:hypothetical protein [Bovine gammaherpesvirus 4]|uniref:Secreted protein n=2 Tax=Bovine herpesvirus 4 TaxID=10385 RepID=A0A858PWR5_BHV4|nr:hypothetical protein [Bovine gammaherpesvirus 4]AAK07932.1 hypothetical protein [Bovine gammaherpesvirus 4]QJC19138.1 hypothetical protein [Bovine gammaherpesvirus 4]
MGILNAQVLRIRYLQSLLAIFCSSLARARPPENVLCPGWLFCAYIGRPQFGGCVTKQTSERGCNNRSSFQGYDTHTTWNLSKKSSSSLMLLKYLTTC